MPEKVFMGSERRNHTRLDISFPVECDPLPERNHYFYTVCKNLSLGGAKILTNTFLPKDKALKLTINFIHTLVTVKAKVAWCAKERISDRYSIGLVFTELDTAKKKHLTDFLGKAFPG
jgi:c-di-GMP-binding flagellar brake protein YcgR